MSNSVVFTTSGASFMATAGTVAPMLPIRYFLLQYDNRLDPYVLPTSGLTPVLSADTVSAVGIPYGDTIYNIDTLSLSAYSISNDEFLIYDSNQSGTSTISNNRFNDTSNITLLNGAPLSNSISATSMVYNYPNWTVTGYTLVSGSNAVPTGYSSSRDKYFRVTSFAPISSAAGGQSAGLFKVLIDNTKGNFKFNKILLYAARILSGGVEDTSIDPVLVGIAYLNSPVIKSNDGTNLNFFEADIEVQFSANNYFGNVSYLNNNNWNYVGGENLLWSDAKIAIGTSAIPGSWLARAKLHITEDNPSTPMMRITNDNLDSYVDTFLAELSQSNSMSFIGSKTGLHTYFITSGATSFSDFEFFLNHDSATRHILMEYITSAATSISTKWSAAWDGTYEVSNISVDSNVMATFKSINSSYATLVLGKGSDNLFEHIGKFLTVHGGTVLVGSSLVSGSLSGNDTWRCNYLYTTNDVNATGYLVSNIGVLAYGSSQVSIFDSLRIITSADFRGPITFSGTISGNATLRANYLYTTNDVNATGYLVANTGVLAYGSSQVSIFDSAQFRVSADFDGPVSMNQRLTTVDSISAGRSVSAYGGFYELDRGVANGYWKSVTLSVALSDSASITATTHAHQGQYTLFGKTMILHFNLQFRITGSPTYVEITLPDSYVCDTLGYYGFGVLSLGGNTDHDANVSITGGTSTINISRADYGAGNFPSGVNISIYGYIIIPLA